VLSRGSKARALAPLALVALALTGAPVSATRQPTPPVPGPPGDAQVVAVNGDNRLAHAVRGFWGNWQRFDEVGPYGHIGGLTSTCHLGEENLFFHTSDDGGRLVHLVRHGTGTWDTATAPTREPAPTGLAVTDVAGTLALIADDANGPALSMQREDGTWSPWMAVPTDGRVTAIAATAEGNTLRVVELAADGHTVAVKDRAADGRWSDAGRTAIQLGVREISAAQVDGELQLVAVAGGGVGFSRQTENGSWTAYQGLPGPGEAVHVAATASMDDLQVVYTTTDGKLYHSLRLHSGSWQPWGDVENENGAVDAGAVTLAADPN
jgi:hypothetical protein